MKHRHLLAVLLATAPLGALAQTAAPAVQRFDRAPWWMDQPVIPSMGSVTTALPANRAKFTAGFQAVGESPQQAMQRATAKVRDLTRALSALGAQKATVTTTVGVSPIYSQYRDKDGKLISNDRADKIDSYQATATVSLSVRDLTVLERAYAQVIAAGPTSAQTVYFSLEPSNEQKSQLFGDAIADAARRAKLAAQATGAQLGPVKLIDPTGRACEADVLIAGAPRSYGSDDDMASDVPFPPPVQPRPPQDVPPDVTPPPPSEALQLALQAPMEALGASACVVYAISK